MSYSKRTSSPQVPPEYAGRWVAWDREQTRILACGRTFDEARKRAAEAGETSVILAKAPEADRSFRLGHHMVYMVAVFISQLAP